MPPKKRSHKKTQKGEGNGLVDWVKSWFHPKNSMSNTSNKTVKKFGDLKVVKISIRRKPIYKWIDSVFNAISFGKWTEAKKKASYDDLFHLSAIVQLENSTRLMIEKNEKINITASFDSGGNEAQWIEVQTPGDKTLHEMLQNTLNHMGNHKFFQYNAFENNCQDFIIGFLKANNLLTPDAEAFIKQDTVTLLKEMPGYAGKISQFVTDMGGRVSEIFGKGRRVTKKRRKRPARRIAGRGIIAVPEEKKAIVLF